MSSEYLGFLSVLAGRTVVVLLSIVLSLRLMGKRQVGQFNVYDVALLMALANAVQNAMTSGKGELSVGITCAAALLLTSRLMTRVFIIRPKLEEALIGTPTILIHEGVVEKGHLRHELVTESQLMMVIRSHGLMNANEVKLAILEVDGTITVVPKDNHANS